MSCQVCQRFVCQCKPPVIPSTTPSISWTAFSEKKPQNKTQIIFREGNQVGIGWFMEEDTSEWRGHWIAVIDLLKPRIQLNAAEYHDGSIGWYFDDDTQYYIDVEKDSNGNYSIFFRDLKTLTETWFDQADWPITVEYNDPSKPWWLNELTKCWGRGEFTDEVRRAAKVACDMFVPYPVEIKIDEQQLMDVIKASKSEGPISGQIIKDTFKDENLLALHRKLAAAELEAHQWKQRYENANKDRNDLRASMALTMPDPKLQPHQQRVVDEAAALDKKLTALAAFIGTERFYGLSMTECKRLQRQHIAMADYSSILRERIGDF